VSREIESPDDVRADPFTAWLEIVNLRARVVALREISAERRAHEMNAELPAADRAVLQAKGMIR
jgi:hypothetical protein